MVVKLSVLIVGDRGVGKSSLITSYCGRILHDDAILHFHWKGAISIKSRIRTLQHDDSEATRRKKINGSHILVCVFTLYSVSSLKSIETRWLPELNQYRRANSHLVLVGTHLDIRYALNEQIPKIWTSKVHRAFPKSIQVIVETLALIHKFGPRKCPLARLPKPLLFNIISYLPVRDANCENFNSNSNIRPSTPIQIASNADRKILMSNFEDGREYDFTQQSVQMALKLQAGGLFHALDTNIVRLFAKKINIGHYFECSTTTLENIPLIYSEMVSLYLKEHSSQNGCMIM